MKTPAAFGLRFLVLFTLLVAAFEATRGTWVERLAVDDLVLKPTTALINLVIGGDPTELQGRTLVSGATRLHIVRGCEGIEMFLLLAAGILAYPASLVRRAQGLVLGFALAFGLSVLRLTALDWTLRYAPSAWESLHGLVMPLAPVVLIVLYFSWWMKGGTIESPQAGRQESHAA